MHMLEVLTFTYENRRDSATVGQSETPHILQYTKIKQN